MWQYNYGYSNELYHHGILGQRWGVRRYQNKDRTLTAAGKKRRYGDSNTTSSTVKKKSSRQSKLEETYRSKGMTQQEAEEAAAKRVKAEKYVAAAAAVTVAACVAYCAYRNYAVDKTISSNTDFQRVMKLNKDQDILLGPQYLAYDKRDKVKYKGMLGKAFQDQTQVFTFNRDYGKDVVDVSVKAKQDIKVASPKKAQDTFMKLYKENDEFRKAYTESVKEMDKGDMVPSRKQLYKKIVSGEPMTNLELRTKGYDALNIGLVNKSDSGKKVSSMFYDELKKQGVNAVQDVNDKKYSGYRSKNPIITFDGSYDYVKRVMSNDEIRKNLNKATNDMIKEELVQAGATYAAIFGGTVVVSGTAAKKLTGTTKKKTA